MARYVPVAEVAKMIRPVLKAKWPGVKFSVRSSSYAGGASIRIGYVDGPVQKDVEAAIRPYNGSGFDGMTDYKYSYGSWYCPVHGARHAEVESHYGREGGPMESRCCAKAEQVSMGADYVFVDRELSPARKAEIAAQVAEMYGRAYQPQDWDMVREYRKIEQEVSY